MGISEHITPEAVIAAVLTLLGGLGYRRLFAGAATQDGKGLIVQAVTTGIDAFAVTRANIERQTRLLEGLLELHQSQSSPFNNTVLEAAAIHAIDALTELAVKLECGEALPHFRRAKELIEGKLKTPALDIRQRN